MIILIPSGIFISLNNFFAAILSLPSSLLETPPVLGFLGNRTRYFPARLKYVVKAAPLVPLSSLSICTTISLPDSMQSRDVFCLPGVNISCDISLNGKKPCLDLPKFTKAASKLGSTLDIVPLYIFDLMFFDGKSMSNSANLLSSTIAKRNSSL